MRFQITICVIPGGPTGGRAGTGVSGGGCDVITVGGGGGGVGDPRPIKEQNCKSALFAALYVRFLGTIVTASIFLPDFTFHLLSYIG